ncbi:RNA polymerase I enhancer binding protein [Coemansia sp. RSA 2706]|nr:RNA polymerase I enhancer binding protein [Coemansia sp. RSA 2708]KAJ2288638.1 RNA polymerase I enhancer binding protein [Coemansia sp. RSA 2706]
MSTAQPSSLAPSQTARREGGREGTRGPARRTQHLPTRDGSDSEGSDLAALAELLQTYPGLLEGEVGAVARALTQATVAASKVAMQGSGASAMGALEKVRLGRSLSAAAAQATRSAAKRFDASAQTPDGHNAQADDGEAAGGRAGVMKRRWFTQAHLKRLQSEGVVFKKGKFTDSENTVIDEAVTAFVDMHGLTRQEMYGHLFQRKAQDAGPGHAGSDDAGRQVRRAFWPVLAEALPARPLQAIYHHVRRKIHPHNYQGAWTSAEDAQLQQLVAAHGPAWEAISREMGRTGTNCRDRWRYIQGVRAPRQNVGASGGADAAPADTAITAAPT